MKQPLHAAARTAPLKIGEEDLVVVSLPLPTLRLPNNLTAAEHHIVGLLLEGFTPREIAAQRGAALSTVNKQLGAVYRKAGVNSLAEFVAWITG